MKKVNSVKDLSVSYAATCLATARSQHGSGVVNTIHYRSAASLPKRRGNLNREGKGGFTMVELVVALVIIAIVSLATVSLIITQNNMNQKATQVIEATNVAENAIECFRFAVNDENDTIRSFYDAFVKTGYVDTEEYDSPSDNYILDVHGATIEITIVGNKITIDAKASDGDIIIDNKSYTK